MYDGKPYVGKPVLFYDNSKDLAANNFMGKGPYPALIMQVFSGDNPFCNLKVFGHGVVNWDAGSVRKDKPDEGRYYTELP